MNQETAEKIDIIWFLGSRIVALLALLALLAGMLIWLWFASSHPTTVRTNDAISAVIKERASALPVGEAQYLAAGLHECAEVRVEGYRVPFSSNGNALYGWFGFKDVDDDLVQSVAREVVNACALTFVSVPDNLAEIQERQSLLERAGFESFSATLPVTSS
jgi:hypothetical protein